MPQSTHEKIDDAVVAMRSENQKKAIENIVGKDDRLSVVLECGTAEGGTAERRDGRLRLIHRGRHCIAVITKLNSTEKDLRTKGWLGISCKVGAGES